MTFPIRLLKNQIMIEPAVVKDKINRGGLFIPEGLQQPSYEGVVVAAGSNVLDVNIGNHIMYKRNYGTPVEYGGKHYLLLTEDYIEAILEGGE